MVLWLAVLSLILWAGGLILHKFEVLHFGLLTVPLAIGALLGLIAFVGVLVNLFRHHQFNLIAAVLTFLPLVMIVQTVVKSRGVPRIHDISTDWEQPLEFEKVPEVRHAMDNSLLVDVKTIKLQNKFYKDIENLKVPISVDKAFKLASSIVTKNNWKFLNKDEANYTIEATDVSAIFGFKDDVVIKIVPQESNSLVKMRSASRVGKSDLGMNAQRILKFFADLKEQALEE